MEMEEELKDSTELSESEEKPKSASDRARAFLSAHNAGLVGSSQDGEKLESPKGEDSSGIRALVQAGTDPRRGEVSAATIGRMLGLVTSADLQIIENKVDLLLTKINNLTAKTEKIISALSGLATGAEIERVEMQIGNLRNSINDGAGKGQNLDEDGDRLLSKTKIQSNSPQTFGGKVVTRITPKEES
ncbi:MAG: hypothetical protein GX589_08920 [Deltaproteobacteria bacterium]|nr:hypothetical protein [Deltaproteobacteria bacterium]